MKPEETYNSVLLNYAKTQILQQQKEFDLLFSVDVPEDTFGTEKSVYTSTFLQNKFIDDLSQRRLF